MNRVGIDRILVLTGICLLLIVLAFHELAFNAVHSKRLEQLVTIGDDGREDARQAYAGLLHTPDPVGAEGRFALKLDGLQFESAAFYSAHELQEFRERGTRVDRYQRILAPPLALRSTRTSGGVLLEWDSNPSNDALQLEADANPLLKTGYRIYRWRAGAAPAVIATGKLTQTRYLDSDLGPRGGEVFYSVLTVLEGRIGTSDTVIESQRSETLTVQLADAFDFDLVSGTSDRAVVEVVLPEDPALGVRPRHRFEVGVGDTIGALVVPEVGAPLNFETGWVVNEIREVNETRDQVARHPVFNPDGSRTSDENGFVFRDEVRKIPVRRLEVQCTDAGGTPRVLSLELP